MKKLYFNLIAILAGGGLAFGVIGLGAFSTAQAGQVPLYSPQYCAQVYYSGSQPTPNCNYWYPGYPENNSQAASNNIQSNTSNNTSNGSSSSGNSGLNTSSSQKITITITDSGFNPATVTVQAGTLIDWVNSGSRPHSVTEQYQRFDSGSIAPGQDYSDVFFDSGTYNYFSTLDNCSMSGSITITSRTGSAGSPANNPTGSLAGTVCTGGSSNNSTQAVYSQSQGTTVSYNPNANPNPNPNPPNATSGTYFVAPNTGANIKWYSIIFAGFLTAIFAVGRYAYKRHRAV